MSFPLCISSLQKFGTTERKHDWPDLYEWPSQRSRFYTVQHHWCCKEPAHRQLGLCLLLKAGVIQRSMLLCGGSKQWGSLLSPFWSLRLVPFAGTWILWLLRLQYEWDSLFECTLHFVREHSINIQGFICCRFSAHCLLWFFLHVPCRAKQHVSIVCSYIKHTHKNNPYVLQNIYIYIYVYVGISL